ncbi:hypothetical protein SATMO3_21760 [Sporomusa aerivorans]
MENKYKVPVGVTAYHDPDGKIKPLCLHWTDGRKYEVDKLLDVRMAASLKAGGVGMRYNCWIVNKQVYLFCDEGKCLMEK